MPASAIVTGGALGLIALALLFLSRAARRGTTLTAPAAWCAVSIGMITLQVILEAAGALGTFAEPLRFIAAVSSFCPVMALLGAKRPQHTAWQWIVGSLWGLLALPALESLVFRPGQALHVSSAWQWLMVILLAIEAMNHLPTRYWPSALFTQLGQVFLVGEFLPVSPLPFADWHSLAGLAALVAALALVSFGIPRLSSSVTGLDRVWIDFRNSFGAAWGLRILQRLQETARTCQWDVQCTWQGFYTSQGTKPLTGETSEQVEQALANLLWRFVSPEWIEQRGQHLLDEQHPSGKQEVQR
jgi:hypothetical protein